MHSMIVSEQARRATLSLLPMGAFETTPDGSWDFVSPALVAMFGDLPTSSLLGREWLTRIHPDDFQRVVAEYRQAREFGRNWHQTFRMVRADGSTLHVGIEADPLPQEPTSRGVRYVGLVKDRSAIVRAEQSAREADELVWILQEAAHEGIIINRVDVTVAANTAAARILGFDAPADLIGMSGEQRLFADDYERLMRFARSTDDCVFTGRMLQRDGSPVEVVIHGRSIVYAGAPARLVTFVPVRDPLVEAAVASRNELQLHALERLLRQPYHRIALEGTDAGRIEFANREFAAMLQREPEELVGVHIADITHPDEVPRAMASLRNFVYSEGMEDREMRKRYVRTDGTAVEVQLRSGYYRDPVSGHAVAMTLSTELAAPPCCRDLSPEELEQCLAFRNVPIAGGNPAGPA